MIFLRICIVGGGKVGYYLAKTLLERGHEPVVIELDRAASLRVANALDIPVIHGDGASMEALRAARCGECTALACVSGQDETNLIAAQLGKDVFHVAKTVARVNNPKNTEIFHRLGVDMVMSSTMNLAQMIEREIETSAFRHLMSLSGGDFSLVEMALPQDFPYNGAVLSEVEMPEDALVVGVVHDHKYYIPRGTTRLYGGDRLTFIASEDALRRLAADWKLIHV